jgi:hypothetical protein
MYGHTHYNHLYYQVSTNPADSGYYITKQNLPKNNDLYSYIYETDTANIFYYNKDIPIGKDATDGYTIIPVYLETANLLYWKPGG